MQDALRPDDETFNHFYEAGYRQWYELYLAAGMSPLDVTRLEIETAFPRHPYFPPQLDLDSNSSSVLYATGTSTWETTKGNCDLPPFQLGFVFGITAACPTIISLQSSLSSTGQKLFGEEGDHISVLTLAWAYVLSARWTQIIPGASTIEYTDSLAMSTDRGDMENGGSDSVIDIGDVTDEAVRWWAAVLAPGEGWIARIHHNSRYLQSPWSVKLESARTLLLLHGAILSCPGCRAPASFSIAVRYILDYSRYHGVQDQSRAAFAAALLLPTRHSISKQVRLPVPQLSHKSRSKKLAKHDNPPWGSDICQLDRLLTMSCNTTGMISLLSSSFIEPDLPCNVCGAWIQGAFAVLDIPLAQEPRTLTRMLVRKSPNLGFLWLGGILMGVQHFVMKWARPAAFKIDLHSAAWTDSFVSFIQKPVSGLTSNAETIQRSDEARLMFLSQAEHHSNPPLVPFSPFGFTAIKDCILEVQMHALCSSNHGLRYAGWVWNCRNNTRVAQDSVGSSFAPDGNANDVSAGNIVVDYGKLDRDRDCSESMTRNMFKWLREADGFPIAERPIREHEWIDEGWSSEEESVAPEGDGKSTTDRHVGPWLCREVTTRCNTI